MSTYKPTPYKLCPRCRAAAPLSAPFCRCGHAFRTAFAGEALAPPAARRSWLPAAALIAALLVVAPCVLCAPFGLLGALSVPASEAPKLRSSPAPPARTAPPPAAEPAAPRRLLSPESAVFRVHGTDYLVPPGIAPGWDRGLDYQPGQLRCPFCGGTGSKPGELRDCHYCLGTRMLTPAEIEMRTGKRVVLVPLDQPSDYVR